MIKRLFWKLFGRKRRKVEEDNIDHTVYSTDVPGVMIYRGTYILTSPQEFALRRDVHAAGMQ